MTISGPGYLYGSGDQFPRVGPKEQFHWVAEQGIALPRWILYRGTKNLGIELYATNEVHDIPDLLNQMLTGLNSGYSIKAQG